MTKLAACKLGHCRHGPPWQNTPNTQGKYTVRCIKHTVKLYKYSHLYTIQHAMVTEAKSVSSSKQLFNFGVLALSLSLSPLQQINQAIGINSIRFVTLGWLETMEDKDYYKNNHEKYDVGLSWQFHKTLLLLWDISLFVSGREKRVISAGRKYVEDCSALHCT